MDQLKTIAKTDNYYYNNVKNMHHEAKNLLQVKRHLTERLKSYIRLSAQLAWALSFVILVIMYIVLSISHPAMVNHMAVFGSLNFFSGILGLLLLSKKRWRMIEWATYLAMAVSAALICVSPPIPWAPGWNPWVMSILMPSVTIMTIALYEWLQADSDSGQRGSLRV